MARDFDGTNDNVVFGSDASIDQFVTLTIALWLKMDATSVGLILCKDAEATGWILLNKASDNKLRFSRLWTAIGRWDASTALGTGFRHVAVVYDGNSASNDAAIYIDGVAETITRTNTPSGTIVSDAAVSLKAGENGGGTNDLDAQIQNLCYVNALWSTDQINRHRWWGDPGGACAVKHPWFTSKLANEGTATADGTATGSIMGASIPRVERRWGAMMGVGR